MKRILSILISISILAGIVPMAHAAELQEVSTFEELREAIGVASDGDVILLTNTIEITDPANQSINITDKRITIRATEQVSTFFRITDEHSTSGGWFFTMSGMDIDGRGSSPGAKLIYDSTVEGIISKMTFTNCTGSYCGGAILINRGTVHIQQSDFSDCMALAGAAVYASQDSSCYFSECSFTDNFAKDYGGAIYSMGYTSISCCSFTGNICAGNGGAVSGTSLSLDQTTITGNQASVGGGVHSVSAVTVGRSKIYNNSATESSGDLYADGNVTVIDTDYNDLFSEELSSGEFDKAVWCLDEPGNRYNDGAEGNTEVSLEELESGMGWSLAFALLKNPPPDTPEPEPEPEPEPAPTPTPAPEVHIVYVPVKTQDAPEKKVDQPKISLSCGKMKLDQSAVAPMLEAIEKYFPATERITRGRVAFLLNSLAEENDARSAYYDEPFKDISISPYRSSIIALTAAGAFTGNGEGLFRPEEYITYGEILTVLSRFVEPKTAYTGSFLGHWAEPAATTACAYGWIDDVPLNLDAPLSYGAFVNLISKVYKL